MHAAPIVITTAASTSIRFNLSCPWRLAAPTSETRSNGDTEGVYTFDSLTALRAVRAGIGIQNANAQTIPWRLRFGFPTPALYRRPQAAVSESNPQCPPCLFDAFFVFFVPFVCFVVQAVGPCSGTAYSAR